MLDFVEIIEALALLAPCGITGVDKTRIGNKISDGGYVMADHFRPGQKVYSYGISNEVTFDHDLAQRGLEIFMYDHTIKGLPFTHKNFHWLRQGISVKDDPGKSLYSLASHVAANNHDDDDMVLKMDVEGAEWDVLDQIDALLLSRFEQLTMEIHSLTQLKLAPFRQRFVRVFKKLNSIFNLIHVHSNNTCPLYEVAGQPIAALMEVTLLRKDIGRPTPWRDIVPTALDAPNTMKRDHVLNFFPFQPVGLPPEDFKTRLVAANHKASATIVTTGRNIAPEGQCSQSSRCKWSRGPNDASNALRQVKNGNFAFHTAHEEGPWWQIDFGEEKQFDEIICYNRIVQCAERASQLTIAVSADEKDWQVIHENSTVFGGVTGTPLRVVRERLLARYVRLSLPGRGTLHLDGVEIFDWTAERGQTRWNTLLS